MVVLKFLPKLFSRFSILYYQILTNWKILTLYGN